MSNVKLCKTCKSYKTDLYLIEVSGEFSEGTYETIKRKGKCKLKDEFVRKNNKCGEWENKHG